MLAIVGDHIPSLNGYWPIYIVGSIASLFLLNQAVFSNRHQGINSKTLSDYCPCRIMMQKQLDHATFFVIRSYLVTLRTFKMLVTF